MSSTSAIWVPERSLPMRKPLTAVKFGDGAEATVMVICDDGVAFSWGLIGNVWTELPPIPGTPADEAKKPN